ncbi:MAG: cobalt ECF transporter T component CbiQ [Rhodovulum sulfidophilum]|uniref:Cobalt ECF transporter T component CbiQ n=1 Tax=Rhodovulum sulfidophilum TaxID=35806 RepID=A0A2W5N9F7_RHOSU|nr:MAG: cobalt ECF transporter T component CbiQ [Rhodovulum sulfidophilum]
MIAPAAGDAPPDLRAPLIAAVIIACGTAMLTRPATALIALGAALALAASARIAPRAALRRLGHVEGFLVVLLVALPFTTPGTAAFALGPLAASREGLSLAALIALKVNVVALALLALLGAAPPERLGRALHALGAPKRFTRLIELLFRHSHTARDSLRRQSEAMRARGFRLRATPHALRGFGHLVGGTLLRAMDRAERVEEAMRLRGAGAFPPAPLGPMGARALAGCALTFALAAGLVALDRWP